MSAAVLDASAILAFIAGEDGADTVEAELDAGARCGAANWSEVAQKMLENGRDWDLVRALYSLDVDPVEIADAEWAARRWNAGEGLSLADRLCLALSERVGADVLTAYGSWGTAGRVKQIR